MKLNEAKKYRIVGSTSTLEKLEETELTWKITSSWDGPNFPCLYLASQGSNYIKFNFYIGNSRQDLSLKVEEIKEI